MRTAWLLQTSADHQQVAANALESAHVDEQARSFRASNSLGWCAKVSAIMQTAKSASGVQPTPTVSSGCHQEHASCRYQKLRQKQVGQH
jgi:hypothetical protein